MTPNRKIKAFTLSEMIIVLILTSIVVGLAFMVLTLVQKHMASIQNNLNQTTELRKLESGLWLDFNHYSTVRFNGEKLAFSSELDSVSYYISSEYVIKDQDTFFIPIAHTQGYFKGKRSVNNIDAIKLETTKVFQNQELFIFKQNDAAIFMK